MSRPASGVYYYSEVEPGVTGDATSTPTGKGTNTVKGKKSSTDTNRGKKDVGSPLDHQNSKEINFKVNNILLTGKASSPKEEAPQGMVRTRSSSTGSVPATAPSVVRIPSHKSMISIHDDAQGRASPPPTYDSLDRSASRDSQDDSRGGPHKTQAKVMKRNPSFWDIESKKTRNQTTLRRYTDVGIVTVSLNVSGTIFSTSTNTLLRETDTLFATILEREETSIKAGKHIFLDRNPKYFGPILDYMRTGAFDRDANIDIAKSIMLEAEGLIKILHDVPEFTRLQVLQIVNGAEKPKLRGLWLPTINLAGMDLTRANFDFTQLGKANFRNTLLGGSSICNASCNDINLRNAILSSAQLAHTDFVSANLSNAVMRFVKCLHCDFSNADLSYVVFEGSDFQQCDFTGANLSGADFTSTDISNSIFRNAIFSEETVFSNTITKGTDFEGSNIDVTKKNKGVFSMLKGKKKG